MKTRTPDIATCLSVVDGLQSDRRADKSLLFYDYDRFYLVTDGQSWWSGGKNDTHYFGPLHIDPLTYIPTRDPIPLPRIDNEILLSKYKDGMLTARGTTFPPEDVYPRYVRSASGHPIKVYEEGYFFHDIEYWDGNVFVRTTAPRINLFWNGEATELDWIEYKLLH